MNTKQKYKLVSYTATYTESCTHNNGWYDTIRVWWSGTRVFYCTDCKSAIYEKELKQLQKARIENEAE